jgi:two-component system response regulator DevR
VTPSTDVEPLRIMLVEDHSMVRAAIKRTLSVPGMEVVAEAGSAEEALAVVMLQKVDVILVDLDLPGMNGVDLVRELSPRLPDCRIIILTGSSHREDIVAAFRNGASGYLTKDTSPEGLVRAVQGVRNGDLPMPRRLAAELVQQLLNPAAVNMDGSGLSQREREVLERISDGLTDREIGAALGISPRTVGRHVGHILDKLAVRNRNEAAQRFRHGT